MQQLTDSSTDKPLALRFWEGQELTSAEMAQLIAARHRDRSDPLHAAHAPPAFSLAPRAVAVKTWGPVELPPCTTDLRWISWTRPAEGRWPLLIEKAWHRLRAAAADPAGAIARRLFPRNATPLPGRARDGRSKDQRERNVQRGAIVNACNVLSVIVGWSDVASGIVAEPPRAGRNSWKNKAWKDVWKVAFGGKDIEELLNREKRTARAVAKITALGYVSVTQIRERDGEEWRSRTAFKRVTDKLWAALGLAREASAAMRERKDEQKARRNAARAAAIGPRQGGDNAAHAGERARQQGAGQTRAPAPAEPSGGGLRELPDVAKQLALKLFGSSS